MNQQLAEVYKGEGQITKKFVKKFFKDNYQT